MATVLLTAGGTNTEIVILILRVIGIHIELAIVGIPTGVDETSARPALALRYPCFHGNRALFIRDILPQRKTAVSFNYQRSLCITLRAE